MCLKIQARRSLYCGKVGKRDWTLRRDTPFNSQDSLGTKFKGKGHLEAFSKKVNLMSEILARPSLRKEHWGNLMTRRVRPQTNEKTQDRGQNYVLFSCGNKGTCASVQKHRRAHVCGWFWSFNAHAEQEGFKLRWNWVSAEIHEPHNCGDGQWRSANERGSTSVRSRSRSVRHSANTRWHACSSITWKTLRRTRMFLRLGQRSKATVDQNGKTNTCTMDNFVQLIEPGLSSSSSSSSASTSRPKDQSNSFGESETSSDPVPTKCQASTRETDADKPWHASPGKPWFSTQKRRDERKRRIQRKAFPIGCSLHR